MAADNLQQLFNGRIFRVPDYQRGYAWGEKQLTELWDDLDEIIEEKGEYKKHYAGTIYIEKTVTPVNESWLTGVSFFDVVDGQQRLTTISILLYELLKLCDGGFCAESKEDLEKTYIGKKSIDANNRVYKFSYSELNKNSSFLLNRIFEDDKIPLPTHTYNLYSKNLSFAKNFFSDRIEIMSQTEREVLFKKLTTSLQFDIRTIDNDLDVQAVFETMNNRGKPLSTLEKLKNRLIFLTEKLKHGSKADKKILRKKINDAWGNIYTCLAENPDEVLDEDEFLSAHLSLYRKPKDAVYSEKIAEERVFKMFCNKSEKHFKDESNQWEYEEPVTYSKIEDYILKLSEAAPIWFDIHNSKNGVLRKILLLNRSKELRVFLLAVFLETKKETTRNEILIDLEKILFRNRVPGIGILDERTPTSWGRDLYNKEDTLQGIIAKQKNLISTPVPLNNLIQSFNNLYTYERGTKGYHRWHTLKYFLFEFDEYLKLKARETTDKVLWSDFDETTIEHIIPQKYDDYWLAEVDEILNKVIEDKRDLAYKILLNTLGNLTILKNGKNSSLGNQGWKAKKIRFTTGSYNEIDVSKKTKWNKNSVSKRGFEMLEFLESKVDGLTLTPNEKKILLFYDPEVMKLFR